MLVWAAPYSEGQNPVCNSRWQGSLEPSLLCAPWTLSLLQLCLMYSLDVLCCHVVLTCRLVWILLLIVPVLCSNVAPLFLCCFIWTAEILYQRQYSLYLLNRLNSRLFKMVWSTIVWTSHIFTTTKWHLKLYLFLSTPLTNVMCCIDLRRTVRRTVMKAMIILLMSLNQTQWKTKSIVALQWLEHMTGTKIEGGHEARAVLENLSKHSQKSFIIVSVHEGFPCLLYSRQPAPSPLSLHLLYSLLCSLSVLPFFCICAIFSSL